MKSNKLMIAVSGSHCRYCDNTRVYDRLDGLLLSRILTEVE